MRSTASGVAFGKSSSSGFSFGVGKLSSIVLANGDLILSMSSAVGGPVTSKIRSSWFIVDVPGNAGRPIAISATMQPTAHMSTALVYLVEPSRISGARYHRVAT
jgi:hypothetical protein